MGQAGKGLIVDSAIQIAICFRYQMATTTLRMAYVIFKIKRLQLLMSDKQLKCEAMRFR